MDMTKTATEIIKALNEANEKKPSAFDTTAEVRRIEGSTAWVHIPGGVDETPAALTIDAVVGDTVQIRVADGNAWLTGNQTAPPTSDKTAKEALKMASGAQKTAARGLLTDTLFYLASDQDSGITVETEGWTEEPQEITEEAPYLWVYHLYTYADGTTEKTAPVIVGVYGPQGEQGEQGDPGDPGDPGAPGVSVTGVIPRYYLSTSSSQLQDGTWSDSLPTYVSGRFYWTRDKITYSNNTTGYSDATYSPGLTQSAQLSYNTSQHFWTQTSGTAAVPNGAYVTEQTESAYKSSPTGGAALIRSTGVDIRKGTSTYSRFDGNGTHIYDGSGTTAAHTLAEFTGAGATIGKSGSAQVTIDYRSMAMTDLDDYAFFEVKDARDTSGAFTVTDTFEGDGTTQTFYLSHNPATSTSYTVTATPSAGTSYKYTNRVYFSTAPADGTIIKATYTTKATQGILPVSLTFGQNNTITAPLGVAFGERLTIDQPYLFALGMYNESKYRSAFEIGSGDSVNIHNIFEVDYDGNVRAETFSAGGFPSGLLTEEVSIVDNLTVASGTSDGTANIAKPGYTPLGVVGFRVVNASSSGTNGALGVISHAYLNGTGNNTANYRVRNVGTASMKVRIYFNILYVKS